MRRASRATWMRSPVGRPRRRVSHRQRARASVPCRRRAAQAARVLPGPRLRAARSCAVADPGPLSLHAEHERDRRPGARRLRCISMTPGPGSCSTPCLMAFSTSGCRISRHQRVERAARRPASRRQASLEADLHDLEVPGEQGELLRSGTSARRSSSVPSSSLGGRSCDERRADRARRARTPRSAC